MIVAAYLIANRRRAREVGDEATPHQRRLFISGIAVLWIGADWPIHDLADPGQPRPGGDVPDAGRAEGREETQDEAIRRVGLVDLSLQPGFERPPRGLAGAAPEAAGRHLDHGH